MCKKTYSKKPEMSVNRVLAEISTQFQGLVVSGAAAGTPARGGSVSSNLDIGHSSHISSQDTGEFAQPGEVPCDACIGRKLKAHKSCVNCPGSFCETHLRHHKKVSSAFHIVSSWTRISCLRLIWSDPMVASLPKLSSRSRLWFHIVWLSPPSIWTRRSVKNMNVFWTPTVALITPAFAQPVQMPCTNLMILSQLTMSLRKRR